LAEALADACESAYEEKEKQFSPDLLRWFGAENYPGCSGYAVERSPPFSGPLEGRHRAARDGQKDPLVEFKKEAFILFEDMMARIGQ